MSESIFTPGTLVDTAHGRGSIIDVRATPAGAWVFGVESDSGEVHYFTERGLRPAQS